MSGPNYCQCVKDYFTTVSVHSSGEFGYYVLQAKTDPAREDCLNQVKAAHAGNAWIKIAKGWYAMKCHYTVCTDELAELVNIFGEPGFRDVKRPESYRERH